MVYDGAVYREVLLTMAGMCKSSTSYNKKLLYGVGGDERERGRLFCYTYNDALYVYHIYSVILLYHY